MIGDHIKRSFFFGFWWSHCHKQVWVVSALWSCVAVCVVGTGCRRMTGSHVTAGVITWTRRYSTYGRGTTQTDEWRRMRARTDWRVTTHARAHRLASDDACARAPVVCHWANSRWPTSYMYIIILAIKLLYRIHVLHGDKFDTSCVHFVVLTKCTCKYFILGC